jgi:nucleoside-diphosphate-sugar epimerase
VYISDVVEANVLALHNLQSGSFNIGTGIPRNVIQVYEELRRVFGDKAIYAKHGEEVAEVEHIHLDITLAGKVLGWTPTVPFEEGVELTVESFLTS